MSPLSNTLIACALLAVSFIAAVSDARTGLIPNWLTLPSALLAPLVHLPLGGLAALQLSILGALVCAIVPLAFFVKRALGGGDLKLFVALGALAGPRDGLEIQLLALVIATCVAIAMLVARGQLTPVMRRSLGMLARAFRISAKAQAPIDESSLTSLRLGVPIFIAVAALRAFEVVA